MVLGFDARHPRAERLTGEIVGGLIEGITKDQLASVRHVIADGLAAGRNPRDVALDIVGRLDKVTRKRRGGILGLNSIQARAVTSARAELEALDAAYFRRKRRDKRFDAAVMRAIRDGKPLARKDIDAITGRYADRLLALRGEVIARTETLNALRAGRHEGYEQLIESGSVQRSQIKVKWRATGDARTRDTHAAMHGQTVTFGQLFQSPSGAQLEYPGDTTHGAPGAETIQCRCYAEYRVDYLG